MSPSMLCGIATGGLVIGLILLLLYALCRAAAGIESVPDGNEEHL